MVVWELLVLIVENDAEDIDVGDLDTRVGRGVGGHLVMRWRKKGKR